LQQTTDRAPPLYPGILIAFATTLFLSAAMAEDTKTKTATIEIENDGETHIGVAVGALVFLGSDMRVFYRKTDSPWVFGFRYLDIEDDFVNEYAVGLPDDGSDKELTTRVGVYTNYLFNSAPYASSWFVSGALLSTKSELRCGGESNSDTYTGPYIGGGYQGRFSEHFGYEIGLLMAPFAKLETRTSICESDSSGDVDANLSLTLMF
jgi:hypothetical protein